MDTPASALRRRSQVFVEVPPSPYHIKSTQGDRAGHPENIPLKAVVMNVENTPSQASSPGQLKRKFSEEVQPTPKQKDAQPPRYKKPKTDSASRQADKKAMTSAKLTGNAHDAFNAEEVLLRCHQCSRHYDSPAVLHCTFKRPNGQRCVLKYCRPCLRNRYDLDLDLIKECSPESSLNAETDKHVDGVEYLFQCPRCSDICNCRICRKVKGLPATGNLHLTSLKADTHNTMVDASASKLSVTKGKNTASTRGTKSTTNQRGKIIDSSVKINGVGKKNATKSTVLASPRNPKLKPHVLVPSSPYKITVPNAPTTKKLRTVQAKPAAPPKPVPKPKWTLLSTPLTHDDAVGRMNIREFLLRFAHLMDIARTHLEELEGLASAGPYTDATIDREGSEDPRLVGWISEPALKAIISGLVLLFLKDANERDEDYSVFTKAIQRLRGGGVNLNKIWSALATLREESDLAFPDLLPPPSSAMQRNSRTKDSYSNSTPAVTTAQFVNVVAALVEAALETKMVQDDFERAATQEKNIWRAARELSAAENARYKDLKSTEASTKGKKADKPEGSPDQKDRAKGPRVPLEVRRAALAEHEALLAKFDFAHRLASSECVPRFRPLGRDTEGRVYYVLSPGVIEREAAVDLLEGGKGEVKFSKRRVAELEERKEMKNWSWFVAVWGRKPAGAEVVKPEKDDEGSVDDDGECWWGFWQPEEVAKLAEWLARQHGVDLDVKRPAKGSEDSTVLDMNSAAAAGRQQNSGKKFPGRPSNTSSGISARTFTSINNSDSDSEMFEPQGDGESDVDEGSQMRLDSRGQPVPTRNDLRTLARGLKDYAELLEWRIKRVAKDVKNGADEEADKGKESNGGPIPPSLFYGE